MPATDTLSRENEDFMTILAGALGHKKLVAGASCMRFAPPQESF
jgi:hypothetical protein